MWFNPKILTKATDTIASFIKESISQSEFSINEVILDALVQNFTQCYKIFYVDSEIDVQILFEAMDKFLIASTHDDQKALKELKQELFMDKNRKLYISLPLEFLKQLKEQRKGQKKDGTEELWHRMVDDFFSWICSSEESLKSETEEEFWNSEEILEAKKCL